LNGWRDGVSKQRIYGLGGMIVWRRWRRWRRWSLGEVTSLVFNVSYGEGWTGVGRRGVWAGVDGGGRRPLRARFGEESSDALGRRKFCNITALGELETG